MLVTGHSQKNDGICILVDTNDHAEALKATVDVWNTQFTDKMKLVIADQGDYMIRADLDAAEAIANMEDEVPRREGFVLYTQGVHFGEITQNMPW
mgnify:CR=1 FL=1